MSENHDDAAAVVDTIGLTSEEHDIARDLIVAFVAKGWSPQQAARRAYAAARSIADAMTDAQREILAERAARAILRAAEPEQEAPRGAPTQARPPFGFGSGR